MCRSFRGWHQEPLTFGTLNESVLNGRRICDLRMMENHGCGTGIGGRHENRGLVQFEEVAGATAGGEVDLVGVGPPRHHLDAVVDEALPVGRPVVALGGELEGAVVVVRLPLRHL